MISICVLSFVSVGVYLLVTACLPGVYRPAETALRRRAPKPPTQTEILTQWLARKLVPLIDIEPVQRIRLEEMLRSLGHAESPELFQATALAKALTVSVGIALLIPFSPLLFAALAAVVCIALYSGQAKRLERSIREKRQKIEWELPQFASTIRQCLSTTCDIVSILETYQKVCGPALRAEIDRTLNDIITGNTERALKGMEGRVASAKLGQLLSGLIAVHRGDDQRLYFDMLAAEFRKSQNEEVSKTLLKRPEALHPYMALLFMGMVLMIAAALGTYILQQLNQFFA